VIVLVSVLGLGACATAARSTGEAPRGLVDRAWLIVAPPGRAPGSLYVFLSDGTLLMTSCVETYRLATWRWSGDGRLEVTEDPITRYTARVLVIEERDLTLRLELVRESVELRLRAADVPVVCPDLPR
jgi:hypothetical protein